MCAFFSRLGGITHCCVPSSRGCAVHKGLSWSPPPHGCFKFNVDESARGKLGPGGCGGVLRNSSGDILALGIIDSNVAEVLAIKGALYFFW
ncbi:hypothetical protein J1N35_008264 [Gossypium stocksii]|uniref:RNase H type-1 domain-containing protein n=1 Tax=Gossypium stocksii TaxID=47602 RepID=A0A9D4AGI6_9ROSI|nr:hypothetical protein J1N35_008264 [Gossypium stocksii]